VRDAEDTHLQPAVMTSAPRHLRGMTQALAGQPLPAAGALAGRLLALAAALEDAPAMAGALGFVSRASGTEPAPWQFAALGDFLEALERRGSSLARCAESSSELKSAMPGVARLIEAARRAAANAESPEALRLAAVPLVGRARGNAEDFALLGRLLAAREPAAVQRAALNALGSRADERAARQLLDAWNTASPALRGEILNALLGRPAWTTLLLAELEGARFTRAEVAPAFQQKLLNHANADLRARAAKVFAATASDRAAVLGEYEGVARLTGDAARGAELFRQQCAVCHRLRGEGREIGPDLGALANKSVPALLTAILDPNQAVEWRYVTYTARVKDGREVSGILAAETAASVTLRTAAGTEEILLRSQIEDLRGSKLSLMPEGLEKALPPQAMADLLAWLAGP
jgi:putative heme-binding domain-containing protein